MPADSLKYLVFYWAAVLSACTSSPQRFEPLDGAYCDQLPAVQTEPLSRQLFPLRDVMATQTGVYTLEEGDVSMVARAWLCESAEKTLDIQYFIFSADNVGLIAIDYLLRAADRGVNVRIIVDDIMVEADMAELLALDAHPNLSIKLYNPTANIGKNLPQKLYSLGTDFKGFNQRMHNKTLIVDGQAVITGGRNMADEYFDYDHAYNFRDRDVLLLGKAVRDVTQSFALFWNSTLSVPVASLADAGTLPPDTTTNYHYLHEYACNPQNFWPQVRDKISKMPDTFRQLQENGALIWVDQVTFVSDLPGKNPGDKGLYGGGTTTDTLIHLIREAKNSIHIQSPYLVTTELSQQLFREAVARGVEIKILTNSLSSTDNLEAFSGYQRERQTLLEIGIRIFEFKPDAAIRFELMTGALQKTIGFRPVFGLHAKSIMIDNEIAVIGTFNLDPRSANLNTECIAVIYDPTVSHQLGEAMEADMKPENAWETTPAYNPDSEAGRAKQVKVWLRGIVPKAIL